MEFNLARDREEHTRTWQGQGSWKMLKDEQIRFPGNLCKFN